MAAASIPRKLVVHFHLFKNAGTSVDKALHDALGDSWVDIETDDPAGHLVFGDVVPFLEEREELRAVSSHQIHPAHPVPGFDVFPIVFLRDPIARIRSAYLFEWQHQLGRSTPKGPLADYVESHFDQQLSVVSNFHVNHLSWGFRFGTPRQTVTDDDDLRHCLDLSREFLARLPAFGLVEEYKRSITLINRELQHFSPSFPHLLVHRLNHTHKPEVTAPDLRDLIRSELGQDLYNELVNRNGHDLALYDFARSRFDQLTATTSGVDLAGAPDHPSRPTIAPPVGSTVAESGHPVPPPTHRASTAPPSADAAAIDLSADPEPTIDVSDNDGERATTEAGNGGTETGNGTGEDDPVSMRERLDRMERRTKAQYELLQRLRAEREEQGAQLADLRSRYLTARRSMMASRASQDTASQTSPASPSSEAVGPTPSTPAATDHPKPQPDGQLGRAIELVQMAADRWGRRQNRHEPAMTEPAVEAPAEPVHDADHIRMRNQIADSGFFDPDWYLEANPDVAAAGQDPLDHYLLHGGFEGRPASELFDSGWYLSHNADVAAARVHPLLHYLDHGQGEGRPIRGVGDDIVFDDPIFQSRQGLPDPEDFAEVCADISFPVDDDSDEHDVEISVVVPIYDAVDYTIACLRSLAEHRSRHTFEVIVMDDCSPSEDVAHLARINGLRYIRNDKNLGFLLNCNRSVDFARGRYIVFLNNDTTVEPGWLDGLRDTFDQHLDIHGKVGVVGSKLVYPDGRLQEAGGIIWSDATGWNYGRLDHPDKPAYNHVREVDYVSGASIMVEKAFFESVGRFDDQFAPAYYEDTDLCFTARSEGRKVLYQPRSVVVHHEGISSGTDPTAGVKLHQTLNRETFLSKWQSVLADHPDPIGGEDDAPKLAAIAADRRIEGRVLIIDNTTPTPDQDSGSVDLFNLIRIFRQLGHRVHFVPNHDYARVADYTERLEALGVECAYRPHVDCLEDYLAGHGDVFDLAVLCRVGTATDSLDDVLALCPSAKTVFYTVDLHFLREQREAALAGTTTGAGAALSAAAEKRRETELGLMDMVDVTVVLSETERVMLTELGKTGVEVIPLIRETTAGLLPGFDNRSGVVFVGGFRHTPNVDAVDWLLSEIWPAVRVEADRRGVPTPTLNIVGSNMPEHLLGLDPAAPENRGIAVYGFVENIRPVFDRVRLSVAPLRYGAGLKGKVATSLDLGVPVVGSDHAFEGMPEAGLGPIAIKADTARELAELIVDLHDDREAWQAASDAGRDYVDRHYSVPVIASRVAGLLDGEPRSVPAELVEPIVVDTEMVGELVHDGDEHLVGQALPVVDEVAQREPVEGDPVG